MTDHSTTEAREAAARPDGSGAGGPAPEAAPTLGFLPRLACTLLTWGLIALAQPGVVAPDGFGHLAFFAVGPWAYAASRPGRRAFLAEWLGHALGLASVYAWMVEFLPAILPPMSIVPALYPALAGVALRRVRGAAPLALLAPVAWTLAEVVRWTLPVPLSFGWFRLGMLMHDTEWLVGSAAFFGTWGLTYGMGALGGLAADLFGRFAAAGRPGPAAPAPSLALAALLGAGPLAGLVALDRAADAAVRAQEFTPGPDVLAVQPAIEQRLKSARSDWFTDLYVPQVTATRRAIVEGRGPESPALPDLVLWGETFLPGKLLDDGVLEAFDAGARPTAYARSRELARLELEGYDFLGRDLAAVLFGRSRMRTVDPRRWRTTFGDPARAPEWADRVAAGEPLLPPGTSFLTGVEAWTVRKEGGEPVLKSLNAVGLFTEDGLSAPLASKVHMVPGGESVEPLKGVPFVVDAIRSVAQNVPDFVGVPEPAVLRLRTREGRSFRMGTLVCYDNAFDDVFCAPLRREDVDHFVVVSNEAWYGASPEMDHMLAFTRIAAAQTQRAVLRATNSGVSALVGPDGGLLEVLEVDGVRKMVPGSLRARVPVPASPRKTFFARTEAQQPLAWGSAMAALLGLGVALGRRRRSG